jgi:hypothetical protein
MAHESRRSQLERLILETEQIIELLESKLLKFIGTCLEHSYQEQLAKRMRDLCQFQVELKQLKKDAAEPKIESSAVIVATTPSQPMPPRLLGFASSLTSYGFTRVKDNKILPDFPVVVPIFATGAVVCNNCNKRFGNEGGLAMHVKGCLRNKADLVFKQELRSPTPASELFDHRDSRLAASEPVEQPKEKEDGRKKGGAPVRKRYTASFKLRMLRLVDDVKMRFGAKRGSQATVADISGIAPSMITRWKQQEQKLQRFQRRSAGRKGAGNVGRVLFADSRGPKAEYAYAEDVVLIKLEQARVKRVPVTSRIIKCWMKAAVDEFEKNASPGSGFRRPFVASNHWLVRFAERHQLVVRRATNKKELSIDDRLPLIQAFHLSLQTFVSKPPALNESNDAVFGRYLPANCFNMDQSPLFLDSTSNETYDRRGTLTVGVAKRKGSDQRFATLTICVRLDGTPENPVKQPFISVIFKGTGQRISQEERNAYAKDVFVDFQPKAWTDSRTLERWSDQFIGWTKANCDNKCKILFVDNLKAQTLQEFRSRLDDGNIKTWLLPKNCTDLVQPVDRHLAKQLKHRIKLLLEDELVKDEAFRSKWLGLAETDLKAKEVRILMTRLVSEAWRQICRDRNFSHLGLQTGCVMVKQGVDREAHRLSKISITGLADYSFLAPPLATQAEEAAPETAEYSEDAIAADALHIVSTDVSAFTSSVTTFSADEPVKIKGSKAKKKEAKKARTESVEESGSSSDESSSEVSENALSSDEEEHGEDELINPLEEDVDDNDKLELDTRLLDDSLLDTTRAIAMRDAPSPPAHYCFEDASVVLNHFAVSRVVGKRIFWHIPLAGNGDPGWIIAEVAGGPPDPSARAKGMTMQLRCTRRIDANTPRFMQHKHALQNVSLNEENYGVDWFLLREA